MKKIYITGAPGTGKSTISKELRKRNIYSFDVDEADGLCAWIDKFTGRKAGNYRPSDRWLNAHEWVCDVKKLKGLISNRNEKLVVVTGVASNQSHFLNLFDKIFLLQCSENTMLSRLKNRHKDGGNVFGKEAKEREYILGWYKDFENEYLKMGAISINTNNPVNIITSQILSRV